MFVVFPNECPMFPNKATGTPANPGCWGRWRGAAARLRRLHHWVNTTFCQNIFWVYQMLFWCLSNILGFSKTPLPHQSLGLLEMNIPLIAVLVLGYKVKKKKLQKKHLFLDVSLSDLLSRNFPPSFGFSRNYVIVQCYTFTCVNFVIFCLGQKGIVAKSRKSAKYEGSVFPMFSGESARVLLTSPEEIDLCSHHSWYGHDLSYQPDDSLCDFAVP